jgi:hypothetical protein
MAAIKNGLRIRDPRHSLLQTLSGSISSPTSTAVTLAFEPNPLLAIEPALKRCSAPGRMLWGTGQADYGSRSFFSGR